MAYKILVLDLDGTLTNNAKEITSHTKEVLLRAQQNGVKIVLASGRPTYGIVPLAEELELSRYSGYILAYNGGKIIDMSDRSVVYENALPQSIVAPLHTIAKEAGVEILTYKNEFVISEDPANKYIQHELFLTKMKSQQVDNFTAAIDYDPDKCLIVGDPEKLIPLVDKIKSQHDDHVEAFRSEPFFLEVVPKGIDKAQSLNRLLAHTGNTVEEMIAIGDGYNDLSMIRLAGLGVAMSNAQPEVKESADYITLSNEEDGVAAVVEKFILQ